MTARHSTTNTSSEHSTFSPARDRQASDRLIVALDMPNASSVRQFLPRLEGQCKWLKVGLELFIAAGPSMVAELANSGYSVFLDLKLHDIPNTVASAVKSASTLGASLLTLHAAGGPQMLHSAQEAAASMAQAPTLLAVTVLTSINAQQLQAVGVARQPHEQVELLARMGLAAGMRGFVCSAEETVRLRGICGAETTLVVPGIRPAGSALGDQQRVATPADALQRGASFLVVGRPIVQAEDPAAAAAAILVEMATAFEP